MIKELLLKKISIKEKIFLILFTFFFLYIQIIGYNCANFDTAKLLDINTYIFILFIPIFYFIFKVLFNLSFKSKEKYTINYNKKSFFIFFLLIFIAWIPIIISFYPNNFAFDASTQVRMVLYDSISTYHPVIHTILLGGLIKLSFILFKTYTIGNFIYALIQALFMDFVFSYFILFLCKEKAPKWLIILSLLLFMFLPVHSVLAISTTKDVIFSGLILLLVIKFYYISTDINYLDKKKNIVYIIIIILFTLMFRNNMLYAFILFFIPTVIILRKMWKKILIIFFIPLLLYEIYNASLINIFNIEKGPRVEAFSMIIQQFARVYNKEKLTKYESSMISNLYKNNSLKKYNSQISDPVKSEFDSNVLFSHIGSYIKLYFKLGFKYPITYIDSIIVNNYGYFYFFDKLPIDGVKTYIYVSCMDKDDNFSCRDECNNNFIHNLYVKLLREANYQNVPILNIFMNIGFNIFIMFFTIFLILYRKKYKFSIPIYILLSLFITNLLGPVALMRYVYPIFVCFPFMLFIMYKVYIK